VYQAQSQLYIGIEKESKYCELSRTKMVSSEEAIIFTINMEVLYEGDCLKIMKACHPKVWI